jgi:uncharacterized protein YbaR (Trm112 family)
MKEKQELYCHECSRYVQFDIDISLNGNHVLNCPICKHEHCRVVKDGVITDDRWDQRNGETHMIYGTTATTTSTWNTMGGGSFFIYSSWMNTTTTS